MFEQQQLTELQIAFLSIVSLMLLGAVIATVALWWPTRVRVCRFCERTDVTRSSTPEWAEPTACADCAAMKRAILRRRCTCQKHQREWRDPDTPKDLRLATHTSSSSSSRVARVAQLPHNGGDLWP